MGIIQRKNRIYSSEDRISHYNNWECSGSSQQSYCEAHNINIGTFAHWHRMFKKYGQLTKPSKQSEEQSSSFIEIHSPNIPSLTNSIEIHYPNGIYIKMAQSDVELLKQLIDA